MVLHPQSRRALAEGEAATDLPVWDDRFDIAASRREDRELAAEEPREPVVGTLDIDAHGVFCRLYRPESAVPGTLVHLHGGGFVFHDVEVHDALARRLANRSGMAVLSVDYRRPPEHQFPAAPEDIDTVIEWLDGAGVPVVGEGPRFVHGDSAGGNLALVAALRNPGRFSAVALTYPFLDPTAAWESYRTEAEGFDPREAEWYWQQYAASPADREHPDLAPLLSDRLGTLPPTLVVTAEHDPLRDEGEFLASRLAQLGVSVVGLRMLGQLHGFLRHPEAFDASEPLVGTIAGFVRQHS